jgi:hypothetical protein
VRRGRDSFYAASDSGRGSAHVEVSGESVSIDCRGLTEAQAAAILAIVKAG